MAIIKCKMCGGELEIAEDLSICECEFCGTKQTIPKVKDENIQNLFNRANYLRMKAEFDKASEIYEKIIQSNEEEAEAYWGLILCKYGIEYVEDPATFKRIPTCHRASFDAVVADEDYKLAIQYADISQKAIYENEAKVIDEIQKGIVSLASREEPYDIFICYKETDADGRRTQDSVIANDIYYQLTQEGFKVFYAAITLEDKLGQEYEPYIFSALNSSKVMLTLGTKPEYFNAVWVKNEWSRFLKIMKKDRSRMLIPCYREMDAYDLPEEFAHLQAQDMSKIGFINDLVRGIKKVVNKEEVNANASQEAVQANGYSSNVMALLKRGTMALEDKEWEKADGFFEEVLNQDAENGEAFLGKLLVENRCSNLEKLKDKYIRKYEEATEGEEFEACEENKEHIEKQVALYEIPKFYYGYQIIEEYKYDRNFISYKKDRMKQKEVQLEEFATDKIINRIKQYSIGKVKEDFENLLNNVEEALDDRIKQCIKEDEDNIKKIKEEYKKFIQETDKRVESRNNERKVARDIYYKTLITDMEKAITENDYNKVRQSLQELKGYKESEQLIQKCIDEINNIKEREKAKIEREDEERREAIRKKEKKEKIKRNIVLALVIVIVSSIVIYAMAEPNIKKKEIISKIEKVEVGEVVEFGKDEYILMVKKDNKVLLISKNAICDKKYNEYNRSMTWEKSTIRYWLNHGFLERFNSAEIKLIQDTIISTKDNELFGTDGGNDTKDKVFLLSLEEVNEYFNDGNDSMIYDEKGKCVKWWLRSPGMSDHFVAFVDSVGNVSNKGCSVDSELIYVRPAFWVSIE